MTKVKICGITNLEDARHAIDCGADELGFNFYAGSKRYVSPDRAQEIVSQLPTGSVKVGVFVNEPLENLLEIIEVVGLNVIQLHGNEDLVYVDEIVRRNNSPLIKAFRVDPTFLVGDALGWPMNYPLFDTHSFQNYGGTGESFNWEEFGTDIFLWFPHNAYLAGGLTPENVAEAVRIVRPHAVDVASGVELSPGKKDPKKIEAFIKNAKNA